MSNSVQYLGFVTEEPFDCCRGHMTVLFSEAPRPLVPKLCAAAYFKFTRETQTSRVREAIFMKLFRPNYLLNESVWYFSWPRGAVKKSQKH